MKTAQRSATACLITVDYSRGEITLRKPLMPAMLTRDEQVIRQDCLCYLMERIRTPA
ncbi:MAG: hypothetical protein WA108_09235 [Thiobacillus sp.]|jgi:hypothetical protein